MVASVKTKLSVKREEGLRGRTVQGAPCGKEI